MTMTRWLRTSLAAMTMFLGACGDEDHGSGPSDAVQQLEIVGGTEAITVGGTRQLSVRGYAIDGSEVDVASSAWASLDQAVATISTGGLVTGVGAGSARITATSDGVSDTLLIRIAATSLTGWSDISLGFSNACGIWGDGVLYCWGSGSLGQLGNGELGVQSTPEPVTAPAGVRFSLVRTGQNMTCALTTAGAAWCWGDSFRGIGSSSVGSSLTPVQVEFPGGTVLRSIDASFQHMCALDNTGAVWCWGGNDYSQFGIGTLTSSPVPVRLAPPAGDPYIQVSTGSTTTCAVTAAGLIYCWGEGGFSELGTGRLNEAVPARLDLPSGRRFTSIAPSTAGFHHCATERNGGLWCWGMNRYGQVGIDEADNNIEAVVPVDVPDGVTFGSVITGFWHTCATATDGRLFCWGNNAAGAVGDGTNDHRLVPVPVQAPAGIRFARVAAGFQASCALTVDGAAWCWGDGSSGQLGNGTTAAVTAPVRVTDPS